MVQNTHTEQTAICNNSDARNMVQLALGFILQSACCSIERNGYQKRNHSNLLRAARAERVVIGVPSSLDISKLAADRIPIKTALELAKLQDQPDKMRQAYAEYKGKCIILPCLCIVGHTDLPFRRIFAHR